MSQPLGKVTKDLGGPRGPDVEHDIAVETAWFGQTVEVSLPRILRCAHCGGGGCDRCERAGAITLRDKDSAAMVITVRLPSLPPEEGQLCLRIPELGGVSLRPDEGRGHLLLRVRVAERSAPEVALAVVGPRAIELERRTLMKRSLFMAVGLILLFLGMLRLSGWM